MSLQDSVQSRGLEERYAVLLGIGRILRGGLRPEALARGLCQQLEHALDVTGFYIALYDADTDTARVVFHAHHGQETAARIAFRGSRSSIIRAGRAGAQAITDPDFATLRLALDGADTAQSAIAAPVPSDDQVIGMIGAYSPVPDAYDADDIELLQAVATLAGVALGTANFIQHTERRRDAAERLEAIGRDLSASLDLDHVLHRVVDAALELLDGESAAVLLATDAGAHSFRIAALSQPDSFHVGQTLSLPAGLRTRLVDERHSLSIRNLGEHPLLPPAGPGTVIAVPLIASDRVIGVLCVAHEMAHVYDREDHELMGRLAVNVAIAIDNARLHEQLRALSLTDPLTGLANRRHLEVVLEREFAAARRGRRLALVLFDLDHFKEYNDTAGHQAGDHALRAFARVLSGETRTFDLAARYGGDEFLCILSDARPDAAAAYRARVHEALLRSPLPDNIGVTAGYAYYVPSMSSIDDLIRAADRDLYRNKRQRGAAH